MTKQQFEELVDEGYDLHTLFLLSLSKEELKNWQSSKVRAWVQGLLRRQLVNEELEITLKGKDLLNKYGRTVEQHSFDNNEVAVEDFDKKFEEWWQTYPTTDYFEYRGQVFPGSQTKRLNKTRGTPGNCRDNFKKILNEGKFTADDIIRATKFHFDTAKEQSYKKKENQLTYIPNAERYLRLQSFAPFVELSKGRVATSKPTETFI